VTVARKSRDHDGNLPSDVTSFVGRSAEIRELGRALETSRLVTLTGVGGVGKSRLALAVARRHRRAFRHGVWFVGLDAVTEAKLVSHAAAAALCLSVPSTSDPEEVLRAHVRDRRMLLVVDNCEHMITSAGQLISSLLRVAPELHVLATSRIALGVASEYVWAVPPLGIAAGDGGTERGRGAAARTEALALLAARADAISPGLQLSEDHVELAERLCRKLEGLPLAIELAATRLRVMSLAELMVALDHRFDVLNAGPSDVPPRHRSLRGAVEWSYELCAEPERELWMQLSFFPSSFELAAVTGMTDATQPGAILPSLEALIGMSIVNSEHADGRVRFRMLETLREFGRERAAAAGLTDVIRRRLCAQYAALAERATALGDGSGPAAAQLRQREERPNLWAALDTALEEPPESTTALRMCASLWFLWVSDATGEGRYWLDRALGHSAASSVDCARALWTAGYVMLTAGDLNDARRRFTACIELARELGETALVAQASQLLGVTHMFEHDLPTAVELLKEATAHNERTGERHPASIIAAGQLGVALVLQDRLAEGSEAAAACLAAANATSDLWSQSWALWLHGVAAWFAGDSDAALLSARSGLEAKAALGDRVGVAACLEPLAWIALRVGEHQTSARLTGASQRLWRSSGGNRLFGFRALLRCTNDCDIETRDLIGRSAYDALCDEGGRLSDEEAVDLGLDRRPRRPAQVTDSSPLTSREREVAELVAQGLSNHEIAARLVIADRTAESHLEHIRIKLGFTSRSQIAAWMSGTMA
jgi:non-specific serine/threonine protein kinase